MPMERGQRIPMQGTGSEERHKNLLVLSRRLSGTGKITWANTSGDLLSLPRLTSGILCNDC
jgi:hypothetical protein